jgi:hypothetical protein
MGFRYGLPIAETISLIKEAFLGKTLVFVFSGDRYPQDTNLAAAIKVQHPDVVLLGLDMPKPLGLDPSAHVFFGRFFFCRNMGEFSRQNSQALLVGVTRQNLGFGACMAIGYEPEQIGQLGAERIEQDLTSVSWLKDGEILQPKTPVIAVNDRLMQRLKITLPEPFLQQHKVESYADI